jgi:hypothetical protein
VGDDTLVGDGIADAVLHGNGGNRLGWADLPAPVRERIEGRFGAAVVAARDQTGGFSPGLAARLRLAGGGRAFIKAVNAARNPVSPDMYRREAEVMALLPAGTPAPRLRWSLDDGDWVVLAYDEVDGVPPSLPWRADQRDRVLAALTELSRTLTPAPPGIATAAEVLRDDFTGWRELAGAATGARAASSDRDGAGGGDGTGAGGGARLAAVDPWAAARLDELAGWEAHWEDASAGDTLLHCDLRADNVLLTADGGVVFVDWPAACVGAPWIDLLGLLPSVAMQGGGDPEELAAVHPLARAADPDALTAVLAALAGYFVAGSLRPAPPGLPTLRDFQRAQGVVALRWLRHRLQGASGSVGTG